MMYDVFIIVTLPLLWLLLNIFSFITIWLYEFGHAIPALVFTRKQVKIYIGTYGDDNGKKLSFGRLSVFIKPKFAYLKQNGLCIYNNEMPFSRQAITVLGGPIISVALICILSSLVSFSDIYIYSRIVFGVALIISLLNFVINLFPRKLSVKSSKRLHYSDGYQLILMMEDKVNYANMMNACRFYDEGDYESALSYLKNINDKYMEESIFSLILSCYIHLEHFDSAKKLQKQYENAKWQESVTADEYYLFGYVDVKLQHYTQAVINFEKAISLNSGHFNSLKGRAFVWNVLKNYQMAKEDATKAIFINEHSSEAFSTRGHANFMLGKSGEAFTDADKAIALDQNNPYAHLVMGLYLLDKAKIDKAKEYFERAKLLDPNMLYVDDQLARVNHAVPAKAKTIHKLS